jgi:hypothetical protein
VDEHIVVFIFAWDTSGFVKPGVSAALGKTGPMAFPYAGEAANVMAKIRINERILMNQVSPILLQNILF